MAEEHIAGSSPDRGRDHGIGWAVSELEHGVKVTRDGWNGKGMYLFYVDQDDRPGWLPFIAMVTVSGDKVPWLASQTDILATDWRLV